MTDFETLLHHLVDAKVEFIIVGGAAATAHGSARVTYDLDIVYRRSSENIERLATTLADLNPYLRGAPPGLPFRWGADTIGRGLNFTLTTSLGDLDILGEITGGGTYEDLVSHTIEIELFARKCACLDLDTLIRVKRAAGRPKDMEIVAELESLREEGPATS